MKLEVETVIKTGRQIVQKQQTENPKAMDDQLTALKLLYNDLGAQVNMTSSRRTSYRQLMQATYLTTRPVLSSTGDRGQAGLGKSSVSVSKVPEGERRPAGVADHQ